MNADMGGMKMSGIEGLALFLSGWAAMMVATQMASRYGEQNVGVRRMSLPGGWISWRPGFSRRFRRKSVV